MKILDPVKELPPKATGRTAGGGRHWSQILLELGKLKDGLWLPIEFDSRPAASAAYMTRKQGGRGTRPDSWERGFEFCTRGSILYIRRKQKGGGK